MEPVALNIFLVVMVVTLLHGARGQFCVDRMRCQPGTVTQFVEYPTEDCSVPPGTTASPLRDCPAGSRCFGGRVGFGAAGGALGTGPCLETPTCTATGKYPVIRNGTRVCNAYYDCSINAQLTIPQLAGTRICVGGYEFNVNTRRCEPADYTNCSIPFTTPTTTAAATPSTASTTPTPPTCTGVGRIADPTSCRRYYRCGVLGRRLQRCPFELRFDVVAAACRRGADCGTRPLN